MTDEEALGRVIATMRTGQGVKRKELAVRAGLSYPFLSQIETGTREPSLPMLREVARALGVPASHLLERAEHLLLGGSLV